MPVQWCIVPQTAAATATATATATDFFTKMCVVRHLFMAFFFEC
jgi:hypothetical protein